MLTVYGFPLSADEIIRAESRHEAIDRMAEEAKAELRWMVLRANAQHVLFAEAHRANLERQADVKRKQHLFYSAMRAAKDPYGGFGLGLGNVFRNGSWI